MNIFLKLGYFETCFRPVLARSVFFKFLLVFYKSLRLKSLTRLFTRLYDANFCAKLKPNFHSNNEAISFFQPVQKYLNYPGTVAKKNVFEVKFLPGKPKLEKSLIDFVCQRRKSGSSESFVPSELPILFLTDPIVLT